MTEQQELKIKNTIFRELKSLSLSESSLNLVPLQFRDTFVKKVEDEIKVVVERIFDEIKKV